MRLRGEVSDRRIPAYQPHGYRKQGRAPACNSLSPISYENRVRLLVTNTNSSRRTSRSTPAECACTNCRSWNRRAINIRLSLQFADLCWLQKPPLLYFTDFGLYPGGVNESFDRGRPRRVTAAQPPPAASGLRKHEKRSGKILYHGETSDLKRRYHEHAVDLSVHDFEYQVAKAGSTYDERRRVEIEKIRRDSLVGTLMEVGDVGLPYERVLRRTLQPLLHTIRLDLREIAKPRLFVRT
jgi:hypothetical protein